MSALKFGDWVLDPDTQTLWSAESRYVLNPKEYAVLALLLQEAPGIVSKETLLQTVWPGVLVVDNAVHQVVARLRRLLDDSARQPAYIETVPKRGYRLIAEVGPVHGPDRKRGTKAPATEKQVRLGLAVLPFMNLSPDGNQGYLSDGISEDILDGLARNPNLVVRARQSSFRFRNSDASPQAIASQLDVDYLVGGTVRVY